MGVRKRNGERNIHKLKLKEINAARRSFTRMDAEKLIAGGADPSEERFTSHKNYHVRSKAFRKMGSPFPEDATERAKLCASLHIKDPVLVKEEEVLSPS